jgi:hypothetical protein
MLHPTRLSRSTSGATPQAAQDIASLWSTHYRCVYASGAGSARPAVLGALVPSETEYLTRQLPRVAVTSL